MVSEIRFTEKPQKPLSMHPQKFALWLFIITIIMLFAAFTSAYIVRQGEGNWLYFELPIELYISTIVLVISSGTMHWALTSARKDNLEQLKTGLLFTIVLGFVFLVSQYYIWGILVDHDVYFVGNPSGSFLYVLTSIHGIHLLSGIIFVIITFFKALKYKIHSKNLITIEMCSTYWHFLDGLWIYLLLFLLLNHN